MKRRFVTLDVFTDKALSGNPLAVVFDADDLTDAAMQAIAGEFNLSETVFVQTPERSIHSARLRIFTPAAELPFAGHPTVGAAVLLAMDRVGGPVEAETDLLVVLEEKIGIVRVAVVLTPDRPGYAVFDVPKLPEPVPATLDRDAIAEALGLTRHQIGFENHKPCRYGAGVDFTYVPVAGIEAIRAATVNMAAWDDAFGHDDHAAAFVYCRETVSSSAGFHARMFAPAMGITEDPATGAAVAAFAGVVAEFDAPREGEHRIGVEQGHEMGRPSLIKLELDIAAGRLDAVRIGGQAVQVAEGVIEI